MSSLHLLTLLTFILLLRIASAEVRAEGGFPATADASTVRGRVMAGYQGWFRCPGDAANMGWIHWSRDPRRIAPDTLTFEMWPDMREYPRQERYPAPGFTHPDGTPATLFSSDSAAVIQLHFEWMRRCGLDGIWLQHFVVDLPGGPLAERYPSRRRVLEHVRAAAKKTGRVWALAYDIAGMPLDRIYETLTEDWKRMEAEGVLRDPRYLRENGKPVVLIWGFYRNNPTNPMTPGLAHRLIDFFHATGPHQAFLIGGGDWNWRSHPDPEWQRFCQRFDGYAPWNVGNYTLDSAGVKRASTHTWEEDRQECERSGMLWLPVVYPGFSWDNLMRKPPGTTNIARRDGMFLWEQFLTLARMNVRSVYVAMFDEADEGTAIFKVTSSPPKQAHFVGYEGRPSDWYLRLTGEGIRLLRGQRPPVETLPIR